MREFTQHRNLRIARKCPRGPGKLQAGLTLIELMVSLVIGMLMIAALGTLIANQSTSRGEIDKSGRMIENGRYGVQTMATDIQMAGYWGELTTQPTAPGAMPDPCTVAVANIEAVMGMHVQGYDAPAALPAPLAACVKNHKPGTDVLVVRRADPDTSSLENAAGEVDLSKVVAGQIYTQTGVNAVSGQVGTVMAAAGDPETDAVANANAFALKKKDKVKLAAVRRVMVDIYFISTCSVPVGLTCTGGDGGTPIPTLKRVELGASGGAAAFTTTTIAEGIENLQIDYGVDIDNDGTPNGDDVNGSLLTPAQWANVMTLKIYLLARGTELSSGFTDSKSYELGTHGPVSAPAGEKGYKRHVFVQSVRLVNPGIRRVL